MQTSSVTIHSKDTEPYVRLFLSSLSELWELVLFYIFPLLDVELLKDNHAQLVLWSLTCLKLKFIQIDAFPDQGGVKWSSSRFDKQNFIV